MLDATPPEVVRAAAAGGFTINRNQVVLDKPIKNLGLHDVKIALHPEVVVKVTLNVARSEEETNRAYHQYAWAWFRSQRYNPLMRFAFETGAVLFVGLAIGAFARHTPARSAGLTTPTAGAPTIPVSAVAAREGGPVALDGVSLPRQSP